MKHIIVLLLLSTACSIAAQVFDPDRPMIMPFTICADSINDQLHENMRKPAHDRLTENGGWVQIPNTFYRHNGKSNGIIIVQDFTYTYHAFDARCPHCFYDDEITEGKMEMATRLRAICNNCGAQAMNIVSVGSGQLTTYDHGADGPKIMNSYSVKVIKKGKKTYLRIANHCNGVRNQWKDLPENEFLKDINIQQ